MPAPPRPTAVAHPAAWFGSALALAFADAAATAQVVRDARGEANPLVAAVIARVGPGPAMVLRAVAALVLLTALLSLAERTVFAARALVLATAIHAAVIGWHGIGRVAPAWAG